jgi:hypothetical protein
MAIGTWTNGISSVPQEERCPVIYLQSDRQITPLEKKLQATLGRLWHIFAESHPNGIENCALKLIKIQIGNSESRNTIREILPMLLAYVDQEEDEGNVQQLFSNRINAKNVLKIMSSNNLKQYPQGEDELLKNLAGQLGRIIVFLKVTDGTRFNSELFTNFFGELKMYRSEKEPFSSVSCGQSLRDDKIRAILGKKDLGGWEKDGIAGRGEPNQNVSEIGVLDWMRDWSDNPYGVIFLVGDYGNNFLYLLQVAPVIVSEVSVPERVIYTLYNHKKTITEVAVVALLTCICWNNASGIKMILNQEWNNVLVFLKEFKEKVVNYTHGEGFKTNKQLIAQRSMLKNLSNKIGKITSGVWKSMKKGFSSIF